MSLLSKFFIGAVRTEDEYKEHLEFRNRHRPLYEHPGSLAIIAACIVSFYVVTYLRLSGGEHARPAPENIPPIQISIDDVIGAGPR